jgi:hypothetical protein
MMQAPWTKLLVTTALWASMQGFAAAQYSFDLDVPEGRFSYWKLDDLKRATVLDVDFEIKELRRHVKWRPSFQFALESDARRVALLFFQSAPGGPITASIRAWHGDDVVGDRPLEGWSVARKERVKVGLDWSSPGALSVSANGQTYGPFKIEFVPKSLAVVASTGQLLGHTLQLRDPMLMALLELVDPSQRVETADGLRRRLAARDVDLKPHSIWNAFVALIAEPYEHLNASQRPSHLVFRYDAEVQNGGHYQYFENRSAAGGEETVAALRALGLDCQVNVLSAAVKQWLGRERRPAETAAGLNANALGGELAEFDSAYDACRPTTNDGLKRQLERHRGDFIVIER